MGKRLTIVGADGEWRGTRHGRAHSPRKLGMRAQGALAAFAPPLNFDVRRPSIREWKSVCRKIAGLEVITSIMDSAPAKSGFVLRRWSLRSGALAAAPITADSTPSLPWTPRVHARPVRGLHNAAAVSFGKAADGVTIEPSISFVMGTSNFRWSGRRVRWYEAQVRAFASRARHARTGRSGCLRAAAQL